MKVVLDVNKPSCISYGVQYCSSVEGFLSIKEMHPEDDFDIDVDSYWAWEDYMEKLVMRNVHNFCDEMCIDLDTFSAMIEWNSVKSHLLAPIYEEEDYYADYEDEYYEEF